ncbi:MAG: acetyl-CoA C-acetyltransferase [Bacillota bacterium]|nr:MAG: acetyl-CoA C-acetyltransferase [Bacillota bacterium]
MPARRDPATKTARDAVIVAAKRTPFGAFGGTLKDMSAVDLGAKAIRATVDAAGLDPGRIDYVFMGQVVQAGCGQVPGRQACLKAGLPVEVPSDTVNKVCASSLRAANLADNLIRLGEADIVLAGGMESMSQGPYFVQGARWGLRMGNAGFVDGTVHDGLWCPVNNVHMGSYGDRMAKEFKVTREDQDAWAYRSHTRAIAAHEEGRLAGQLIPVEVPQRKGPPVVFDRDECPRPDTSLEKLAALRPVFSPDGTVTAGNAPPLNDGASALLITAREAAEKLGLEPLATIISQGFVSQEAPYLATVPYLSVKQAAERLGLDLGDLDLLELNEAFAVVTLVSTRLGGWPEDIVNVNGGAVAIGHPIGASGGRILMTLVYEMRRRGLRYGACGICSGGGQGEATIVRMDYE